MNSFPVAQSRSPIPLSLRMANRHGLVTGATGTGKTVSLQLLAENFSAAGVPVFLADVKGDLSGLAFAGTLTPKMTERLKSLGIASVPFAGCPVQYWDVLGDAGHPVRATVSELGPVLLGKLLDLTDVQKGVLTLVFKIADDNGLLLLDLKDLAAVVRYVGENSKQFSAQYGNVASSSVGAIQRALTALESEGAARFFGEPALDLFDMVKTSSDGRGVVNVLAADKLILSPKLYAVFLLSLLSELYERMPEIGDPEKPKFVFFFDEAHLLFKDIEKPLLDKIEQVVRLVRSKGVGVYFVTQNPSDVPDAVLGQLGNRIQHALRAFTPNDQKAVKAAARTFRPNPAVGGLEEAITSLAVGEALVSFLDDAGQPAPVERAWILPPRSRIGTAAPEERIAVVRASTVFGKYEKAVDRESAYEKLAARTPVASPSSARPVAAEPRAPRSSGREPQTVVDALIKSAARSIGSSVGRQIIRGVLGSMLGSRR